jgi:hypothetical protein
VSSSSSPSFPFPFPLPSSLLRRGVPQPQRGSVEPPPRAARGSLLARPAHCCPARPTRRGPRLARVPPRSRLPALASGAWPRRGAQPCPARRARLGPQRARFPRARGVLAARGAVPCPRRIMPRPRCGVPARPYWLARSAAPPGARHLARPRPRRGRTSRGVACPPAAPARLAARSVAARGGSARPARSTPALPLAVAPCVAAPCPARPSAAWHVRGTQLGPGVAARSAQRGSRPASPARRSARLATRSPEQRLNVTLRHLPVVCKLSRDDVLHHLKVLVLIELYQEAVITRRGLTMFR